MTRLWLLSCLLAAAPATPPLEESASQHVLQRFERVGRRVPSADPALQRAAETLARLALETTAARAADASNVARLVSRAGGHDPSPRTLLIRASPPERALESLRGRTELSEEPATSFGVASVRRGDEAVIAVLLTERKAELKPFPRELPDPGEARSLCGELRTPLQLPEVYVTRPNGTVDKIPLTRAEGREFCSTLPFPADGEHSVEVIGQGPQGPEVAALFFVDVGAPSERADATPMREPTTLAEARQALQARINALRVANGARSLQLDDTLNSVAQAYSERMAKEHFFAHIAPDGASLNLRLRRAGFGYRRAGENLGLAAGPLSAHFGIEQSPGHRKNLLEPGFELLGLGVAYEEVNGREQAIVTEVLATPTPFAKDAVVAIHQALARRRAQLKLPALERTVALDDLALERAREALERGEAEREQVDSPFQKRVFATLTDAQSTSVDLFVSDRPDFIPDSESLRRRQNHRVGVGAVRGHSPAYGKEKYWVVVIYTGGR